MDKLDHLREAEVAVRKVTEMLPEARVFPDMMKMNEAPYVCIDAKTLMRLLNLASDMLPAVAA